MKAINPDTDIALSITLRAPVYRGVVHGAKGSIIVSRFSKTHQAQVKKLCAKYKPGDTWNVLFLNTQPEDCQLWRKMEEAIEELCCLMGTTSNLRPVYTKKEITNKDF